MLGTHGLRRVVLYHDPRDNFSTSLVDIPVGWKGGGIAHYHHFFEEVYIVSGSVTVGAERYWHAGDYFYRPAQVVHGHDEKSPEGCRAIIRGDGPLELILVHDPREPDEYPRQPIVDPRGHILSLTVTSVPWGEAPDLPVGWKARPLSLDPITGARTRMIAVPAGWHRSGPTPQTQMWEAVITSGAVDDFEIGDYAQGGAGSEIFAARACPTGAEFMLWEFPRGRTFT